MNMKRKPLETSNKMEPTMKEPNAAGGGRLDCTYSTGKKGTTTNKPVRTFGQTRKEL